MRFRHFCHTITSKNLAISRDFSRFRAFVQGDEAFSCGFSPFFSTRVKTLSLAPQNTKNRSLFVKKAIRARIKEPQVPLCGADAYPRQRWRRGRQRDGSLKERPHPKTDAFPAAGEGLRWFARGGRHLPRSPSVDLSRTIAESGETTKGRHSAPSYVLRSRAGQRDPLTSGLQAVSRPPRAFARQSSPRQPFPTFCAHVTRSEEIQRGGLPFADPPQRLLVTQ